MSQKPETTFIASVHRLLPETLYRMKTHNAYISGPADVWYSGRKGDLWVEYKYTPRLPEIIDLTDTKKKYALTALQQEWINSRYSEGRRVFVILGFKEGGVVFRNGEWNEARACRTMSQYTRQDLAELISTLTKGSYEIPARSRKRLERCV